MVREGPQESYFNEERLIALTSIRFQDELSPIRNVVDLSRYLFMYPLEYAIIGSKILMDFNFDLVKFTTEYIKTQPRLSLILSKKAFRLSNSEVQKDNWTDVEHKIESLPKEWSESAVETELLKSKLKLPARNEFISVNFELKKQPIYLEEPILIDEDSHFRCYFKNDKQFKTPKSCIYLNWNSSLVFEQPETLVSLKLFVKYFELFISEYAYPAESANLQYSIDASSNGLHLKVNGLNEKLFKLLKLIIDHLKEVKIDLSLFETIKLELIRDYYNTLLNNQDLVYNLASKLSIKNYQTYLENRELVKQLDAKSTMDNVRNFFHSSYVQCLIQGNYTEEESKEIFNYIKSTLVGSKELVKLDEIKRVSIHELPIGDHYCYLKSFNRLDENVLVFNNYQLGKLSQEEIVMLDLLMQEMWDPLFNILRNQQTLAYSLFSKYSRSRNDICSFQIMVKSLADKFTPQHVDSQIEWFIQHFLQENILKMTDEHFKELKDGRIKTKQVPFLSLKKEANFNWGEIISYNYRFGRTKQEIEILRNLQMDKFIEFSKEVLTKTKSKLSICSIGTGKKTEDLFTCLNSEQLELLGLGDENEDEINNDELNYSLILMEPTELKSNCKLIKSIEDFVCDRNCF